MIQLNKSTLWLNYGKYLFCLLDLFLILNTNTSVAQSQLKQFSGSDSFNIKKHSFLLPQSKPSKKYSDAISLNYVIIPSDWTLDQFIAPMFNYSAKYSLNKGFTLQANLATLLVSNRISAGPFWNYSKQNLHFGVGYQLAFNYGRLKNFGFNSVFTGWEHQPTVEFGINFKKTALTFRADLYYTSFLQISQGGTKTPYPTDFINGYSYSVNFEQRLYKQRVMSLGLKIDYLAYHVLAWPALPVNNYRYLFPEFQVGLNF